jgi:Tol biopolymer transport system component
MKAAKNIFTLAVMFVLLLSAAEMQAQFGKNKVQYKKFDWKYIESENFDIYYDAGSKSLAEFAAVESERALLSIQSTLNYKMTMRVGIVVYDSHNDFQQTNVTNSYMPEGVGGFTELFKNRVVVPFQGSYSQLRHVLHHELVHAVLNDMFYGGTLQSAISTSSGFMIPLWLNEGLCEFESLGGMNTETDMFMRDLTISERLPPLNRLYGYLAYRGGQTFYWYVAEKYGKAKVTEFVNKLKIYRSVELAFEATFNMKISEFSEMWERDIKRIYWPDLTVYDDPKDFSQKITDRRETRNFYNTSPAISPNGEQMAYISDREGLFGIYVQDLETKKSPKKLISSLRKQDFEDLNILTPGISWDPTGKSIAISAKSGGQDAVFITNASNGRYERLLFGIPSISSVSWSNCGKYLAFIGTDKEQSDIYIYEISTKNLTKATDDIFSITQIAWAPDSKSIFYVSDRDNILNYSIKADNLKMWQHDFESSDIFRVYIDEKRIERITHEPEYKNTSIAIASDGNRLLFVSDKSGIGNIYQLDLNSGSITAMTNSLVGISQLSLSPDDSKLLFSAQVQGGYDIFMIRMPLDRSFDKEPVLTALRRNSLERQQLAETISTDNETDSTAKTEIKGYGSFEVDFSSQQIIEPNPDVMRKTTDLDMAIKGKAIEEWTFVEKDYAISFSSDLILVNPGYSTFYGFQGMTQMLFSDALGDHQIYLGANLLTDLKNSQFVLRYSYLPDIIDYHIGGHHTSAYFYRNDGDLYRFRNYGATALASYPFDLFTRLEWGIDFVGASMENLWEPAMPNVNRFLTVPQARFVFDNALGGWYAPDRGMRAYIEFLGSPKYNDNSVGFMTMKTDIRQYFRISDYISVALRGAMGASFGPNPQVFFLGGTENWINSSYKNRQLPFENPEDFIYLSNFVMPLRGWDVAEMHGSKFFAANAELRFPLFTALVAGPVPILLQGIMGSIFADVGGAWDDKFIISAVDDNGKRYPVNMLVSSGIGVRSYLLGMPVKLDIAWTNDYNKWSKPKYLVSLGFDF